jgi:hypothetical protein
MANPTPNVHREQLTIGLSNVNFVSGEFTLLPVGRAKRRSARTSRGIAVALRPSCLGSWVGSKSRGTLLVTIVDQAID